VDAGLIFFEFLPVVPFRLMGSNSYFTPFLAAVLKKKGYRKDNLKYAFQKLKQLTAAITEKALRSLATATLGCTRRHRNGRYGNKQEDD
jgi:hypothetical protein